MMINWRPIAISRKGKKKVLLSLCEGREQQSTERTEKRARAHVHVYAARVLVANQHISLKRLLASKRVREWLFFRGARWIVTS